MKFVKNIGCRLGFHNYEKFMGPKNAGGGKFSQKLKCSKCGKITEKVQ